jgi:hypothetical protein
MFHLIDLFAAPASHAILFVLEILPEQCSFSSQKNRPQLSKATLTAEAEIIIGQHLSK